MCFPQISLDVVFNPKRLDKSVNNYYLGSETLYIYYGFEIQSDCDFDTLDFYEIYDYGRYVDYLSDLPPWI